MSLEKIKTIIKTGKIYCFLYRLGTRAGLYRVVYVIDDSEYNIITTYDFNVRAVRSYYVSSMSKISEIDNYIVIPQICFSKSKTEQIEQFVSEQKKLGADVYHDIKQDTVIILLNEPVNLLEKTRLLNIDINNKSGIDETKDKYKHFRITTDESAMAALLRIWNLILYSDLRIDYNLVDLEKSVSSLKYAVDKIKNHEKTNEKLWNLM